MDKKLLYLRKFHDKKFFKVEFSINLMKKIFVWKFAIISASSHSCAQSKCFFNVNKISFILCVPSFNINSRKRRHPSQFIHIFFHFLFMLIIFQRDYIKWESEEAEKWCLRMFLWNLISSPSTFIVSCREPCFIFHVLAFFAMNIYRL